MDIYFCFIDFFCYHNIHLPFFWISLWGIHWTWVNPWPRPKSLQFPCPQELDSVWAVPLSNPGKKGPGIQGPGECASPVAISSAMLQGKIKHMKEGAWRLCAPWGWNLDPPQTSREHARNELANCSYAFPAPSELNGTKLKWADPKRKVRSSTCLSFLLKQRSTDVRRAGRECTWLTFL